MKFLALFAVIFATANAGVILRDDLVEAPIASTSIVGPSGSIHKEELGAFPVRTAIPTAEFAVAAPAPLAVAPVARTLAVATPAYSSYIAPTFARHFETYAAPLYRNYLPHYYGGYSYAY